MKKRIIIFNELKNIIENNSEAFADKPNAILLKNRYITRVEQLEQLQNSLVRPFRSYIVPRRDLRNELRSQLFLVTDFGILLSKSLGDQTMMSTFVHYRKKLYGLSVAGIMQVAADVLGILETHQTEAATLGLPTESVQQLQQLLSNYRLKHSEALTQLDGRREDRNTSRALVKECNAILRDELDRFVRFNAASYPAFARNYFRLRRKNSNVSTTSSDSEISGTVTDNLSGLPLTGAKVRLIEQNWEVTTESDGAFLFDDLKPGTYHISCQCDTYKAAEQAVINLGKDDAVVWNFKMEQV